MVWLAPYCRQLSAAHQVGEIAAQRNYGLRCRIASSFFRASSSRALLLEESAEGAEDAERFNAGIAGIAERENFFSLWALCLRPAAP